MTNKKILYCDLDSTLNNHWVRIRKWAIPKFPGKKIDSRAFTREEIMKDKPLPNSVEAIDLLSKNYTINILSARGFKDAYSITKEWLDLYNFKYDSINIVKSAMAKVYFFRRYFFFNRKCDLLIDDFSKGQEYTDSFEILYDDVIKKFKEKKIKYEIFKNNWSELIEEYT